MAIGAPDITKSLFGGILDVDGAGHYAGLELINLVVCSEDGILPGTGAGTQGVRIRRAAHEFARQLVTETLHAEQRSSVLLDEHTEKAIAHLLRCLELEIPNLAKSKGWERTHFFPYTRSLVHWDARQRDGKVRIERRYLRGGGAYAFSVLRRDPDPGRLQDIRAGFERLYPRSADAPLEMLAATLRNHGHIDAEAAEDKVEAESDVRNDTWEELYRDGMRNLLGHVSTPSVQRVRGVMNWTSMWLALMQAGRASHALELPASVVVLDCAGTHPQLRRASQRCLKDHIATIERVAATEAGRQGGTLSAQQTGKVRGFFTSSAAACGLLNAWKGRRHFTLRLPAVEALVLAAVPPGRELELDEFLSEWMYRRCGLVAGRQGAGEAGLLSSFDATIFEENERRLAEQMRAAGMLRVFSDATRMVSTGETR